MKYAPKAPGVSRDAARRAAERGKVDETKKAAPVGDRNLIRIHRPACRLEGGPRHGWVYYVSDMEQAARSRIQDDKQPEYEPTRKRVVLPYTGGHEGVVWKWTGAKP